MISDIGTVDHSSDDAIAPNARLLYVDLAAIACSPLFGAEGIVAKRRVGLYRAGPSREWLKIKRS